MVPHRLAKETQIPLRYCVNEEKKGLLNLELSCIRHIRGIMPEWDEIAKAYRAQGPILWDGKPNEGLNL